MDHPNWESAKKHFEAFWNRDYIERCNLSIRTPKAVQTPLNLPPCTLEERFSNPEIMNALTRNALENADCFCEAFPSHMLYFGTGAHCEFFGCRPNYAETTIWFDPVLDEPDASRINFDAAGRTRFERQLEIASRLAKLAGDSYMVSMPDNCGVLDSLAELRGNENLLMDFIDEPEFVHEARDKIYEVWEKTQKEFYKALAPNNDGGSSIGWMQLWCPGSTVQLQCDFSVMVSPSVFEEFALPELERASKAFDHTVYHFDGVEQLRHLDLILSVKDIDCIQWTPVAAQPKTSVNIKALQKIQSAGKGLVLFPDADEVPFLLENLSHKGLHMMVSGVRNAEEALALEQLAVKLAH